MVYNWNKTTQNKNKGLLQHNSAHLSETQQRGQPAVLRTFRDPLWGTHADPTHTKGSHGLHQQSHGTAFYKGRD